MLDENEERLLMSEDLRGQIPEIEDSINQFEDAFIVVVLEVNNDEPLAGSLNGISVEQQTIKVDIKTNLREAYLTLNKHINKTLVCSSCHLHFSSIESVLKGPFTVSSVKLIDIDRNNKTCILGIDLFRN